MQSQEHAIWALGLVVAAGACYYLGRKSGPCCTCCPNPCPCDKESLYARLGGAGAIQAVVDGMYKKIFTDERLTEFFTKTDRER